MNLENSYLSDITVRLRSVVTVFHNSHSSVILWRQKESRTDNKFDTPSFKES